MEATSDDKQFLYRGLLRILIRRGLRMYLWLRRYPWSVQIKNCRLPKNRTYVGKKMYELQIREKNGNNDDRRTEERIHLLFAFAGCHFISR
jgi:hypothetical protein